MYRHVGVEVPPKNGEFIFIYKKGTSTHERLTMRSQIIKKNVRMFVGSTVTIQLSQVYRALGSWVIVCYFGKPTVCHNHVGFCCRR